MQDSLYKVIAKSSQTIFSFKELMLMLKLDDSDSLKARIHHYITAGDLYHIRRGLYAKNANYNRFELATKILTPAYVSFETVLVQEGIIFQYYSQIFVASYQSREIECDNHSYLFRTLKPTILINTAGIETHAHYSIATKERAFLDTVYLKKRYHFDNLEPLDWNKVYDLLPVYGTNKSLRKRVETYHASHRHEIGA